MPPLKNIKHEQFAHAVLAQPSASLAYKETYKTKEESAHKNAHRLTANEGIRNRIQELMRESSLSEADLVRKLHKHTESDKEIIALDAVKTGFKLFGAFDDSAKSDVNMNNLQVNVQIIAKDS